MSVLLAKRLITVEEYHKMAEAGILTEDECVELIHGEIIEMSPIGSLHSSHVIRISRFFNRLPGDDVLVGTQSPVTLDDQSEPQPDIFLARFREDFYASQHPTPEDVFLIIEVAETSLQFDQGVKKLLFAEAGIPEFWIINLIHNRVEVHKNPLNGNYLNRQEFHRGDTIFLEKLDIKIKVEKLLG